MRKYNIESEGQFGQIRLGLVKLGNPEFLVVVVASSCTAQYNVHEHKAMYHWLYIALVVVNM